MCEAAFVVVEIDAQTPTNTDQPVKESSTIGQRAAGFLATLGEPGIYAINNRFRGDRSRPR
ncbi:hypothetical protein C5C66_01855 [Rathayibacter toxicus]|uniref:Uncharacterized protein n=1 Tax=Rathayibacter toxicus TaxID=145458 RepID=A0A0C5BR30_9MICO|nr:hypothetical protein TI83_02050 [Rathayibacter toxicus]ALS57106.1 hypothetical protein APU90_04435 [Rathayibacter toxicus]KKM46080.1 hypothetical protein VT73_03060 [Rathayibacter toxicus]PPG23017.1 hypothetical protein C5D15_01830 [Rathayibacter toxicus]PPG47599.1 hypothetical protein C5D16_01825 [Rathayibacter toxicus]